MATNVSVDHEDVNGVRVLVESDRLEEEGSSLSFKFTSEGLVIDLISAEGEILKTFSNMYDEVETLLT